MDPRPAVTGFDLAAFEALLVAEGLEKYRAKQVLLWTWRRLASSFSEMTDLSLELRAALEARFRLHSTRISDVRLAPDGTEKLLVALDDGNLVETVLIREGDRKTVCVSTQVGCPIRCVFCASGLDGLVRNLTAGEIAEQVLHVARRLPPGERVDNVVVMGIGEPLLNYPNLVQALRAWKTSWGMGIGYHRITLSTVGVLDKVEQLVADGVVPNLAISLHAPNDRIRVDVVPTMKRTVVELIKAGIAYREATGKNVTFEYVLLDGVNDDKKHALELGKKLRGTRCKVNVIPFNPVPEVPYAAPSQERIDRFCEALGGCGVPILVRKRKGDAISAACGQLRHVAERRKDRDTSIVVAGSAIPIPADALKPAREAE